MNAEAKEAKKKYMKAYMREWRKKNKDKAEAAQEKYWAKKNAELQKEG